MEKEITFRDRCDICGEDGECRNHHWVPKRLQNILNKKQRKKWEHFKSKICNKCNDYIHPENKLYERIEVLVNEVKKLNMEKDEKK